MFNDILIFDNFALFVQSFFFVIMITKLLCEDDNVIFKKYNYYALSLIHNSKIYEKINVL